MDAVNTQREDQALAELVSGLFSLVLLLRASEDYGPEERLRRQIKAHLERVEQRGLRRGYAKDDLDAIRFPLVAFLDETIKRSAWEHAAVWRERPLQLDLFGEHRAGTEFFERLENLRRTRPLKHEILEVYHICLMLGFQGKYASTEEISPIIDQLRQDLGYKIQEIKESRLSPHGKQPYGAVSRKDIRLPGWPVLVVAGGAVLLMYVVTYFLLNGAANQALKALALR